jgi:hypothetical protein
MSFTTLTVQFKQARKTVSLVKNPQSTITMIFLPALGLILALYVLEMQAAPSAKQHGVSTSDLARNSPEIQGRSGTVNITYKYFLPEPNRDDFFEVDGVAFYKYSAGGIKVDPGFWEERDITFGDPTK